MNIESVGMNPTVLRCGYFNGYFDGSETGNFELASRVCYDYELEFFINSDGGVIVDGKYYPFTQGEINIRKPGQRVIGIMPYECHVLCVDLAGKRCLPKGYLFGDVLNAQPCYGDDFLESLPVKLKPRHCEGILRQMKEIERSLRTDNFLSRFKANTLAASIIAEVIGDVQQGRESQLKINKHISKAVEYISLHFTEELSINGIIESLGLSKAYFNRSFKEYCGMTPLEMITSLRMEKARLLLTISRAKISEVAEVCGYCDAVYFTSQFKKLYGITPTRFREDQQA